MKRIIFLILRSIYISPIWFLRICRYAKNADKYTEKERFDMLRNVVFGVNKAGRIKINVFGLENLPKENGYIMFPNHQGLFDVLMMLESHERPFSAVLKKEMEKNFFVNRVVKVLKAQYIDRDDVRQSMKVIMQMTKEVKEGRNYVIFPEGTRSRNGNNTIEFKGGSFKSATNAKCPIVPVALIDSYKVFDTNSIKKQEVSIYYLEPMYYEEYKDLKTNEIAEIVRDRIQNKINEIAIDK